MRHPADFGASAREVHRIVMDSVALMAFVGDDLAGTIGIMKATWWYAPAFNFLTDRWYFVRDHFRNTDVDSELRAEALRIAIASGLELIINGKARERNGVFYTTPRVYR